MVENNSENLEPKVELEQQEVAEVQAVVEETVAPVEVAAKPKKSAKAVVAETADFDWNALEEEDKGFSGRTKKDMEFYRFSPANLPKQHGDSARGRYLQHIGPQLVRIINKKR